MSAALGILAATLSIAVVWPQVWLSCRHRRTLGLSPTSAWLAVALNLCWLAFGLLSGDPVQIVTNAVVGAGNAAVLVALLLTQPRLRAPRVLLRTASGAVVLAALATGGPATTGLLGTDPAAAAALLGGVASVVGAAAALPQPVSLLRDRTQDLSGLSPARWWLGSGSCAAWTGYGWCVDQPMVWLSAGIGLCCALVVCGMLRARRAVLPVAGSAAAAGDGAGVEAPLRQVGAEGVAHRRGAGRAPVHPAADLRLVLGPFEPGDDRPAWQALGQPRIEQLLPPGLLDGRLVGPAGARGEERRRLRDGDRLAVPGVEGR
ncbi:SemiSWEET transporter [Blastococcus sp. BMG 814]|uniref:SemiSWEET transporter n=1 Tax=Blastococcus carthaginiensis TaxID=3050034 RepID=A0ABT9ID35_9ACTN|nr:SemiSWEET transporter [Blastococcus carthaginiensis]MDP5183481.1 SemiSWEET transporter [Blastococcus carthaginiensis]